jgi:hypothetical protein
MFKNLFKPRVREIAGLFTGHFVEAKAFYALTFDAVSCVTFIGDIDTSKAFAHVQGSLGADISKVYQHSYFDHAEGKMLFNNTLFVLRNKRMIELGANWCQVLHTPEQHRWANGLVEQLVPFKLKNAEPAIGFARQAATG